METIRPGNDVGAAGGVASGGTDSDELREVLANLETETAFGPYKVEPETGAQVAKKGLIGGGKRLLRSLSTFTKLTGTSFVMLRDWRVARSSTW